MRQNTNGRGELLNFLKDGREVQALKVTQNVERVARSTIGNNNKLAVANKTYELGNISGPVSDPLIVKGNGRRYKFTNVLQTGEDTAIAEEMEVTQL